MTPKQMDDSHTLTVLKCSDDEAIQNLIDTVLALIAVTQQKNALASRTFAETAIFVEFRHRLRQLILEAENSRQTNVTD